MELRCVRCVGQSRGQGMLAEYLFNGTTYCERCIRWAIREHEASEPVRALETPTDGQ